MRFILILFKLQLALAIPGTYFDIQLDRFEQLECDLNVVDASAMKIRKVNKTRSIIGNMVVNVELGNDVMLEGAAYKKQGNEYRLMPFKLSPQPLCDTLIGDGKKLV
jgi:hypothetical protein